MPACDRCGSDGGFLYTCPDCGGHYCAEHQAVDAHDCQMERGVAADADPSPTTESSDTSEGEPVADPTAAHRDEADGVAAATAPEDDDPAETDMGSPDPAPTANGDERSEAHDDDADQAEAGGVLRRVPGLGRFFG